MAAATGHVVSTVSNALAGKRHVNEETRRQVLEAAERLGYRPSGVARSLRLRLSSTVGVLVPDVSNPAIPEFLRGIDDVAVREGYTILLCNTDEVLERQVSQMQTLLDRRVDGMVLISQHCDAPEVRKILDGETPFVLIQRRSARFRDDYVGSDNLQGMRDSVSYLAGLGHRRIALVTGPVSSSTATERMEAFEGAVQELGCARDPQLIFRGDYTVQSGYEAMHYFGAMDERPTAVIASNDVCALGVQDAASELGLSIPRDLSLLGCDDIDLSRLRRIDLSTLHLPKREMGATAMQLLLRRIQSNRPPTAREVIIPTELVLRGSCASIA
ncbi:LacI family transcriptional regulator [Mesorhizobium sp. RP14(2022)]|uniref:LacI family transcriptional regulator n=1 Tax=Mesorhizobium liriopis TaxID=2953882 RepID=A0ABT1CBS8_9HYPH|nr:LacI family transcriptional regulator [Mesorhizobium liriopis]